MIISAIEEVRPPLTRRQQQVCDLLVVGYRNKEIARMLRISPRTVEDHRADICERLGVKNLAEMILKIHGIGRYKQDPGNAEAEAAV